MKKYLTLALLSIASAVSAQAVIVTGASAGYLTESEAGYYAGRVGYQFKSASTTAHIAEIEIGHTSDSDFGIDLKITPVMANYRAEIPTSENFGVYFGLGLGVANVRVKGWGVSASDQAFTYQGFAGITYKVSQNAKLTCGARYMQIEDVRMFGSSVEVGNDTALELGLSVKF